jgi:DNA-binding NarL/FixJ family response regulator
MTSVLLCDDQQLVRDGFRLILDLEDDMDVVGEAADGAECIEKVAARHPDVVLMDIRMPRMDGVEATRRLVAAGTPAKILVLTTFDLDEYVYEALHAGASGFMLKDVPRDQLVAAIRLVARGDAVTAPKITSRLIEQYVATPPPSSGVPDAVSALSERELDVFRLIARGRSNAEIAGELFLGEATIKTHVGSILTKLDLRDRVQAVMLAYECGLVRPGEDA